MKILYIVPTYDNGGTLTCLRNLLTKLDMSKYEIEVYAITDSGPNREFVAQHCTILSAQGKPVTISKLDISGRSSLKTIIFRNIAFVVKSLKRHFAKIGLDISPIIFQLVAKKLEVRNYDLVIAFQEGLATQLGSYFKQTPKIAWVHCDYTRYVRSEGLKSLKWYTSYKKIVCVSDFTKQQFIRVAPQNIEKTFALHNIVDDELILQRAKEAYTVPFDTSVYTIVSVGRLDPVKRFSLIPEIASKVKASGANFKWYIFGGGSQEEKEKIQQNIAKFDVSNCVFLAGEVNNPYPYIYNANLLVSTSFSEACPCVFSEAFILHTAVLSADFGSASEFIQLGVNGWISSIDKMHNHLISILSMDALKMSVTCSQANIKEENANLLKKFDKILI